jgi:ABC-2 type transport system permease protein
MKSLRRIFYLAIKDIKDAIRDARVLVALIVPIGIGIFYGFAFNDDATTTIGASIAISADGQTGIIESLQRALPENVHLTVNSYPDQAAVEQRISEEHEDIGLVLPAGFDAALKANQNPTITVITAGDRSLGANYVLTALDPALRTMAGQDFPATVNFVVPPESPSADITNRIGLRTWSVLLSIIMSCCLVAILAIPIVLVEEVEKKTIDALILAMNYWEIVAAKTLLGLSYTTIMTGILIALTRIDILRWGLFAGTVLALSIALLGVGLLLAGLFRSANQLNTWSGLILTPLLAPALVIGPPLPDTAISIAKLFPAGAGMALLVDSVADPAVFNQSARLFLILFAWIVACFALLIVRLRRANL